MQFCTFIIGKKSMQNKVQLLGISNAIVDILAQVTDEFLEDLKAQPGSMILIDELTASDLYKKLSVKKEMSGGSVANTIACFANFGGEAGYIGQVKNDSLGRIFVNDMRSLGVDVRLTPAENGSPTARSHVLITKDGQRTMQTYLGACTELAASDINQGTIGESGIILLEGYLWDIEDGRSIAEEAMKIKLKTKAQIVLSLSDSFCVERHHQAFKDIINQGIDIVFGNEDEAMALTETDSEEEMIRRLSSHTNILFVITRGEKGSLIIDGINIIQQKANYTNNVIDTTGAGDTYTAGFLYGLTQEKSLQECAQLGSWAASKVIQQVGARLDKTITQEYEI
jgi:sugar/nucleoside kinase (ribokinase family)